MSPVTSPRVGCEFDQFLYASVGEDTNGMPLTVLSALARVDVDPWEEASKLTRLPHDRAVAQLASLLGALRHVPVAGLDPERIAAALIALLPCPRGRVPPLRNAAIARAAPTKNPAVVTTLLTLLTYVIFMVLGEWLMGGVESPTEMASSPASAIDSPSTPPASEGPRSAIE